MSAAESLRDLRRSADSAGYLFINPPTSTTAAARDRAAKALANVGRLSRLPRLAILDVERVESAARAADVAAYYLSALAWTSSDPLDRDVILSPAFDLSAAACRARAALNPADPKLAAAAALAAAVAAAALAAARRAARC